MEVTAASIAAGVFVGLMLYRATMGALDLLVDGIWYAVRRFRK